MRRRFNIIMGISTIISTMIGVIDLLRERPEGGIALIIAGLLFTAWCFTK